MRNLIGSPWEAHGPRILLITRSCCKSPQRVQALMSRLFGVLSPAWMASLIPGRSPLSTVILSRVLIKILWT